MSVLDSLMGLLDGQKDKNGAATAKANLQQTWDYPSLVAALPWRYYDDINDLFINTGTVAECRLRRYRCLSRLVQHDKRRGNSALRQTNHEQRRRLRF